MAFTRAANRGVSPAALNRDASPMCLWLSTYLLLKHAMIAGSVAGRGRLGRGRPAAGLRVRLPQQQRHRAQPAGHGSQVCMTYTSFRCVVDQPASIVRSCPCSPAKFLRLTSVCMTATPPKHQCSAPQCKADSYRHLFNHPQVRGAERAGVQQRPRAHERHRARAGRRHPDVLQGRRRKGVAAVDVLSKTLCSCSQDLPACHTFQQHVIATRGQSHKVSRDVRCLLCMLSDYVVPPESCHHQRLDAPLACGR